MFPTAVWYGHWFAERRKTPRNVPGLFCDRHNAQKQVAIHMAANSPVATFFSPQMANAPSRQNQVDLCDTNANPTWWTLGRQKGVLVTPRECQEKSKEGVLLGTPPGAEWHYPCGHIVSPGCSFCPLSERCHRYFNWRGVRTGVDPDKGRHSL